MYCILVLCNISLSPKHKLHNPTYDAVFLRGYLRFFSLSGSFIGESFIVAIEGFNQAPELAMVHPQQQNQPAQSSHWRFLANSLDRIFNQLYSVQCKLL